MLMMRLSDRVRVVRGGGDCGVIEKVVSISWITRGTSTDTAAEDKEKKVKRGMIYSGSIASRWQSFFECKVDVVHYNDHTY